MIRPIQNIFFIRLYDNCPLRILIDLLQLQGKVSRTAAIVTELTMENKYRLIRMAKLGVILFEKDTIRWNIPTV